MAKQYKTIYQGSMGEITEKKSRFIVEVCHVETEEEAGDFLVSIRKKNRDANHNCYAYVLGENGQIQKCSDDGEPAKTAGKPILDALLLQELRDVVIVVTRYFGGTLLGTGGLVRAYTKAALVGLNNSVIITKIPGSKLQVDMEYSALAKLQHVIRQKNLVILDTIYTERVCVEVLVPDEWKQEVEKTLTEVTNGQAILTYNGQCRYAVVGTDTILFHL